MNFSSMSIIIMLMIAIIKILGGSKVACFAVD